MGKWPSLSGYTLNPYMGKWPSLSRYTLDPLVLIENVQIVLLGNKNTFFLSNK